jgi:hypothetical protein
MSAGLPCLALVEATTRFDLPHLRIASLKRSFVIGSPLIRLFLVSEGSTEAALQACLGWMVKGQVR